MFFRERECVSVSLNPRFISCFTVNGPIGTVTSTAWTITVSFSSHIGKQLCICINQDDLPAHVSCSISHIYLPCTSNRKAIEGFCKANACLEHL